MLQEFSCSSGCRKKRLQGHLGSVVQLQATLSFSFYFSLFPKVSIMTLGPHRAIYYRAPGVSSRTHVRAQRRQCPPSTVCS